VSKKMAVLTLTIMTRGCESKQAHIRCQSHKQNRIIFGNDYIDDCKAKNNKTLNQFAVKSMRTED
jgi:hypothetical protein